MSPIEQAKSFLKLASVGNVREAFSRFIAQDFIHHNQYFKGDRESLLVAMEDAHRDIPNTSFEIMKAYSDGETVITQSHVKKEVIDIAVVHIFRFEKDKIVELWDLGQILDKDSPNENGIF